ncbi:hypothetical protein K474DRAFT_1669294 [Panus rudis PR-1116 ss-1]|nr:hypothetical protein K474DRAFT_1669294 [Panus rudis PR-1116 ss-1]
MSAFHAAYHSSIVYHAITMFLFIKSDIKTTLIPTSLSALAVAPNLRTAHIPEGVLWIWLHLLQFNLSNQTIDVDEDKGNKAWRPLPAGRITLKSARLLRWMIVPLCLIFSLCYGVESFYSSTIIVMLTIVYNELGAHGGHWFWRNAVNAIGLAAFQAGGAIVMSEERKNLDSTAAMALCISAAVLTTTIHAQDFKDVAGDVKIGRSTLPIIAPVLARYTVVIGLITWSAALGYIWEIGLPAVAFGMLGLYTGYRYIFFREVVDDQVSYYWYNCWLSIAHLLPYCYRYL